MPQQFHFIGSALMIKKEVYESIGAYHTFFNRMGAEDLYWVYLIMEKYKMCNVPDSLYYYRFNEHSVTGNIANNPSKINVPIILDYLINQRRAIGTDDLENGKIKELQKMLGDLNKPFETDSSYYYYYVAKRRFYEGHKQLSIKLIKKAILKSPLKFQYYKDYLYFLRN
jgi:hypothetical protein